MKKIFKKVILKVNIKLFEHRYRKNNKRTNITFISQNCVGGVLYHMLGLPFLSPTVNMFIEDENFVKLAENPRHYFSLDACPWEECHIDEGNHSLSYPTIKVDDIILCCQHYENCSSAVEAWNKRRMRVNYDELFVISCSWNLHENKDLVKRIDALPLPKVIFTTEEFPYSSCIHLSGNNWSKDEGGAVRPALTSFKGLSGKRYFVDEFDFVQWINK